jgi:hypothetical protein
MASTRVTPDHTEKVRAVLKRTFALQRHHFALTFG